MPYKLLQINFNYKVTQAEYEQAALPLADPIAQVAGLQWKTWIINDAQHEAGGIYLFDDDAALQAYLAGPIVAGIKSHPALSNISVKSFDVMPTASAVTRAPIRQSAHA